jgi:hypothetical protein
VIKGSLFLFTVVSGYTISLSQTCYQKFAPPLQVDRTSSSNSYLAYAEFYLIQFRRSQLNNIFFLPVPIDLLNSVVLFLLTGKGRAVMNILVTYRSKLLIGVFVTYTATYSSRLSFFGRVRYLLALGLAVLEEYLGSTGTSLHCLRVKNYLFIPDPDPNFQVVLDPIRF